MSAPTPIRLNSLLLEREALFLRIHELEHAVAAIFGEPYPFTRPPLPSDSRIKRKPSTARPTSGVAKVKDPLRKLEPGETAYRVTYRHLGQTRTETHDSADALRTLLTAQGSALQVLALATLAPDGTVQAVLIAE
jgi:hypothetical protein